MGRAIEVDKRQDRSDLRQDALENRIKLVEDALEEMIQTRVHHVDLTEDVTSETTSTVIKGTTLEPDEEYTAPVGKRKSTPKTKKTKTATVA